jgi:hypothetical protein
MAMQARSLKVYVDVTVDFDADGHMYPRSLIWEDGERYEIDRVKAVRPAHAERAGGQGDRYTIMVSGKETYLYFEHNTDYGSRDLGRWFVERRE